MKLPEGMITKTVSFEQITTALFDFMDDGVFSPKAICEGMGWDYLLVQHALSNKKKPSMMSMINEERIRRMHALHWQLVGVLCKRMLQICLVGIRSRLVRH